MSIVVFLLWLKGFSKVINIDLLGYPRNPSKQKPPQNAGAVKNPYFPDSSAWQ
jgi:hypothetical protein